MVATLLSKFTIAVIVLLIIVLVSRKKILQYKTLLAAFFIAYFADNFLIILANQYPALRVIPNHTWGGFLVCSWSGKLYSILFTLALLFIIRKLLSWKEIGLTLRQNKGSLLPSVIVTFGLAIWATRVGFASPKGAFDPATLVYLAIMPALNEELVYRGCMLGILDRLMPGRINLLGAWIGWGTVISSILFSLLHGFWFDSDFSVHFEVIALSNSLASGLIFAWLKARTGSLVMPMLAHGVEDFLFFLPRMI